jgi:hypothetical protein
LTGDAAAAYANELVTADLENQADDDTLRKVAEDLMPKGISAEEITAKMEELYRSALEQIQAGN